MLPAEGAGHNLSEIHQWALLTKPCKPSWLAVGEEGRITQGGNWESCFPSEGRLLSAWSVLMVLPKGASREESWACPAWVMKLGGVVIVDFPTW